METTATLMAALAEPVRLKALRLLWQGEELCICELMKALKASQSRMSRHMAVLKAAGLVESRRDAQWVRYRRNPKLAPAAARVLKAVFNSAAPAVKPAKPHAHAAGPRPASKKTAPKRRARKRPNRSRGSKVASAETPPKLSLLARLLPGAALGARE